MTSLITYCMNAHPQLNTVLTHSRRTATNLDVTAQSLQNGAALNGWKAPRSAGVPVSCQRVLRGTPCQSCRWSPGPAGGTG